MKTEIHLCSYLGQSFVEGKMFQVKAVEKIKTHTVFTRVIDALFLTKILYLNLECVIYARKRFYVGL